MQETTGRQTANFNELSNFNPKKKKKKKSLKIQKQIKELQI